MAPSEPRLTDSFYPKEWEQVIQPQEVRSLKDYIRASRVGRGVRLNRKARKAIWPVFEEYLVLLDEHRIREADDAMRDARIILGERGHILPYVSIIVDEAQDMDVQAFRLLRAMVPKGKNDLFVVGDAHQRIYRLRVVLGRCGINIKGRGRRLKINYRTTEENRQWAVSLLKGMEVDDLDGGLDETQLKDACLVARTNRLVQQYESVLSSRGIKCYVIKRSEPEDRNRQGLRVATMHRVKGLEFDRVIIAGVNKGIVPLSAAFEGYDSDTERKDVETRERALLYVAATRAKKEVLITWFGAKSSFIQ